MCLFSVGTFKIIIPLYSLFCRVKIRILKEPVGDSTDGTKFF